MEDMTFLDVLNDLKHDGLELLVPIGNGGGLSDEGYQP